MYIKDHFQSSGDGKIHHSMANQYLYEESPRFNHSWQLQLKELTWGPWQSRKRHASYEGDSVFSRMHSNEVVEGLILLDSFCRCQLNSSPELFIGTVHVPSGELCYTLDFRHLPKVFVCTSKVMCEYSKYAFAKKKRTIRYIYQKFPAIPDQCTLSNRSIHWQCCQCGNTQQSRNRAVSEDSSHVSSSP